MKTVLRFTLVFLTAWILSCDGGGVPEFQEIQNYSTTTTADSITIAWTNPTGSHHKCVFIEYAPDGGSGIYTQTGVEQYSLRNLDYGVEYTVTLKTTDRAGHFSEGVVIKATVLDDDGPGSVTSVTSTPMDNTVRIGWTKPADSDFDHVEISYSPDTLSSPIVKGSTTAFTDISGLTNGTEYTFTITPYDSYDNEGTPATVKATPVDNSNPANPSDVEGAPEADQVTLTWTDAADADLENVEITYSPNGPTSPIVIAAGTETATITGLEKGTEYTFTLKSVDDDGNYSSGVNATATPTKIVRNASYTVSGDYSEGFANTIVYDSKICFEGSDGTDDKLYFYNGSVISNPTIDSGCEYTTGFKNAKEYNGKLYFLGYNSTGNARMYELDRDTVKTVSGPCIYGFHSAIIDNGILYYVEADDGNSGSLGKFDGTTTTSLRTSGVKYIIAFNNEIFCGSETSKVYCYDGTSATEVSVSSSGETYYRYGFVNPVIYNSRIYFQGEFRVQVASAPIDYKEKKCLYYYGGSNKVYRVANSYISGDNDENHFDYLNNPYVFNGLLYFYRNLFNDYDPRPNFYSYDVSDDSYDKMSVYGTFVPYFEHNGNLYCRLYKRSDSQYNLYYITTAGNIVNVAENIDSVYEVLLHDGEVIYTYKTYVSKLYTDGTEAVKEDGCTYHARFSDPVVLNGDLYFFGEDSTAVMTNIFVYR